MEINPHQSNSFQQNPDNPSTSPLPPRPSPEANNNVAPTQPAQQQHQQKNLKRPSESNQVSVTSGIPPLSNPTISGRKRRSKKSKSTQQTDISLPQFSPQIPPQQQDLLRHMQQNQLLPQQQRQSQWPQPQPQQQDLLRQKQQNQLLPQQRRLLPQAMLQSQWPRPQPQPQPQQQRSPQMLLRHRQSSMQLYRRPSYSSFLIEVMHYRWAKPQNNSIGFWRQYVAKYYDSEAKEKLCLSMCNDKGISPWNDTMQCNLCSWKPESVFEVSFEELPERLKAKFDRMEGERLDVGMAQEHNSVPGVTILLYPKATQRSIYGRESIVHEGLLRVAITDQCKILSWEFCVSRREVFVSFPPHALRAGNWLGIGEIFRRPKAKNVPAERPQEGLQRSNHTAQDAQPQADKNTGVLTFQTGNKLEFSENCSCPKGVKVCDRMEGFMDFFSMQRKLDPIGLQNSCRPCPGSGLQRQEMMKAEHQANAQRQPINHITMNSTRAIHPGPSSNDVSNHNRVIRGQNANRILGKAVSIGVDNIQTAALPVDSRETCLIRNPAANLRTPCPEEQLISHCTMNYPQAKQTGRSSHMIIGGQNANGIPGNGVADGGVKITQTAAASPVESGETGQIPNPAMELQVQEMPAMEHPASAQWPLTNKDTMNSRMVINDCHIFNDQHNGIEILLEDCLSHGVDITEATALADEDIEKYLIDNPAAEFHTQEMQVMNHQASVQAQLTNHGTMNYETMYPDPSNSMNNDYHIIIDTQNDEWTIENNTTAELGSLPKDADNNQSGH